MIVVRGVSLRCLGEEAMISWSTMSLIFWDDYLLLKFILIFLHGCSVLSTSWKRFLVGIDDVAGMYFLFVRRELDINSVAALPFF